jgi:NTP pyrophosphatase (non-canonical NTP hydrolase)
MSALDLNQLSDEIHEWSRGHGFWDHEKIDCAGFDQARNPSIALEKIALMMSELAEAVESERDGDTNTEEELADTIIRILDFCGWRGYQIEDAILRKVDVNKTRPYKHGRQA